MFIGTSNQLGEFESGLTAAIFGVVPAVLIGGFGTIVVVMLWMHFFPQLARIDSFDGRFYRCPHTLSLYWHQLVPCNSLDHYLLSQSRILLTVSLNDTSYHRS